MALRVGSVGSLAGAMSAAYPADYAGTGGFSSYVLYTDFGQPRPTSMEPYVMAALLPTWRAPASVRTVGQSFELVRTAAPAAEIETTDTYLGAGFSLGTMSGNVGPGGIPVMARFAPTAALPNLYFFANLQPCHVRSVQDASLALVSFNFDDVGYGQRRQAWVKGILGRRSDIEEVYAYGTPWNGQPTAVGELVPWRSPPTDAMWA